MNEEIKALKSENDKLKNKLAKDSLGDVMDNVKERAKAKAKKDKETETEATEA